MKNMVRIPALILLIFLIHSCKKDVGYTGKTGTVNDIDGNTYKTIGIGSQIWMAENLKTTKYTNGDSLGTTAPLTLDISGEGTPKYQWIYDGDENNVTTYGRLYTWYAVADSRNVCPTGWHVPNRAEWTTLINYLINNGYGYECYTAKRDGIAKSMAAKIIWNFSPETNGINAVGHLVETNNSSGFTALPSGNRVNNGTFNFIIFQCGFWSTTETDAINAYAPYMYYSMCDVERYSYNKQNGLSVRCLKDN